MKLSVVGGRYTAKVSGALHVVRVTELKEIPPASWSRSDKWRTLIYAVNEATGRKITIRSAQRLRARVDNVGRQSSVTRTEGGNHEGV
jgi:hypothetical protein